jgi:putative addiction module component (TIGR02574 family)
MTALEIEKMSIDERLVTIERLWESLSHEKIQLSSPEWHEVVLEQRKQEMDSDQASFLTIQELRERYR